MAQKRMFSKTIIDSDSFLDMPHSTQLLYFHLSMRADDDGFINNCKNIMRMIGCKDDDLKILIAKNFIIPFESGVIVIKHWRIHNYIQSDRYTETKYKEEKATLFLDENKAYTLDKSDCIQSVYSLDTQNKNKSKNKKLEEDISIIDNKHKDISSLKETKKKYGEYKHVLLTDKEYESIKKSYSNYLDLIKYLDEYIEMKGYKAKSHYLCIKKWVIEAVDRENKKNAQNKQAESKKSNFNSYEQRQYQDLDYLCANGGQNV